MTRTFNCTLEDEHGTILSKTTIQLTVHQIEYAATLEILQTRSAVLPIAPVLEALLVDTDNRFKFRHVLGESREVKVAMSGLLGRFVARAYFNIHHNLSIFCQTKVGEIDLGDGAIVDVARTQSAGDLPDWVSLDTISNDMVVIEAKGSHDPAGPLARLNVAWEQAQRITFLVGGFKPNIKRFAIANRWAVEGEKGLTEPLLRVRDPREKGDLSEGAYRRLALAYYRQQLAEILFGLGHKEIATALQSIKGDQRAKIGAIEFVLSYLDFAQTFSATSHLDPNGNARYIGNCVSSFGVASAATVLTEREIGFIARIDPQAKFVGIDAAFVKAVALGDWDYITATATDKERPKDYPHWNDGAGVSIFSLNTGLTISSNFPDRA